MSEQPSATVVETARERAEKKLVDAIHELIREDITPQPQVAIKPRRLRDLILLFLSFVNSILLVFTFEAEFFTDKRFEAGKSIINMLGAGVLATALSRFKEQVLRWGQSRYLLHVLAALFVALVILQMRMIWLEPTLSAGARVFLDGQEEDLPRHVKLRGYHVAISPRGSDPELVRKLYLTRHSRNQKGYPL